MDKFVLLTDLGKKPTRVGVLYNNSRSSGALEIVNIARSAGVDATNLDYWRSWDKDLIKQSLLTWFDNVAEPWIGLSGSIDGSSTDKFKELVLELKKDLPQLKVMLGGYRVPVGESDWVDIAFIGRSVNIFKAWLNKEPIDKFVWAKEPLTLKNPSGVILEDPVAPILHEQDFWSDKEVLSVETALGCKFNCSFCGYDFRNNKHPVIVDDEKFITSLQTAHDKFGISKFFLADDTINEVDYKLEFLVEASKKLTFTPDFMAFVRADVVGAKPYQIDMMREANINSMFFGVESMTAGVTKMIRKGGKPENMLRSLRTVKQEFPEAFTYGNWIVGLTGDSESDIWNSVHSIVDEQLLTSAGSNTLRLYSNLENPDVMSDIDKEPEKFGYDVIGTDREWPELGYSSQSWKNDWTSSEDADELNLRIDKYFADNLQSKFTGHEMLAITGAVPGLPYSSYNTILNTVNRVIMKTTDKYIQQKSAWMLNG